MTAAALGKKGQSAELVSKAVRRASDYLDLPNSKLAAVLGVSPSTASRLRSGEYILKETGKEFELAVMLVRLFRSLDAIMGSDDQASRAWLRADNRVLEAKPIDRIGTIAGLIDVVAYLDANRAPI